jgi:transcription antitermination factor NusG
MNTRYDYLIETGVLLMPSWYAVRILPIHGLEFSVRDRLNQREHQALVPFEEKWQKRRSRDKRVVRKYPIFPCYVFAAFFSYREFWITKEEINQRAIQVGKHPPIVGLVGMGAKPAKLSQADVSMLQAMSLPRTTEINLHKALTQNGRASIVARGHPFEGHTVTVDEVTRTKCRVLLSMLGSMRVIEIDANALEAA